MARTKGSLNKATVAKQQAQVSTALDVDKHNNIVRGTQILGKVSYRDGCFVGHVGGEVYVAFDLDHVLDKVKEAGV